MQQPLSLYFVRHAKTEWNEKRLLQGSRDSPLTAEGITETKLLAEKLRDIPFIAGYSSPQKRAKDTLGYLLTTQDVPCYQDEGLCEYDFGRWEGISIDALQQDEEYQIMLHTPALYTGEKNGGESNQHVLARGLKAIERITRKHSSGAVLIVSHGAFLRLLLHVLAGGDWREHRNTKYDDILRIANLSVSHFDYYPNVSWHFTERFHVEYINKNLL